MQAPGRRRGRGRKQSSETGLIDRPRPPPTFRNGAAARALVGGGPGVHAACGKGLRRLIKETSIRDGRDTCARRRGDSGSGLGEWPAFSAGHGAVWISGWKVEGWREEVGGVSLDWRGSARRIFESGRRNPCGGCMPSWFLGGNPSGRAHFASRF